jgi:hypothetical protein
MAGQTTPVTKADLVKILNDAGIYKAEDLADLVLKEVEENQADIWKLAMAIRPKGPVIDQI